MPRYQFTEGAPLAFVLAFCLMLGNFLVWFGVMGWADFYGDLQPTGSSTYPIHFKGGVLVYVPAALGHYIEWGMLLHGLFLALMAGMLIYYVKTGRAVRVR